MPLSTPYLLSSMLRIHNSPLTIIFFAVLFDIITIFVWLEAAQFFLNPTTFRRAALLVLCNRRAFSSNPLTAR
jgi:hypothetical protein